MLLGLDRLDLDRIHIQIGRRALAAARRPRRCVISGRGLASGGRCAGRYGGVDRKERWPRLKEPSTCHVSRITSATHPHTVTMVPGIGVHTHTTVALNIMAGIVTAGDRRGASEVRTTKVAEMSAAFFVSAGA